MDVPEATQPHVLRRGTAASPEDVAERKAAWADTFGRSDPADVAVVDGFGAYVSVERGALTLRDGLGATRRKRTYPKVGDTLRRLVVLGHTAISTDALRWCARVGVTVAVLDPSTMTTLATSAIGADDARLRRQQAKAPDGPAGVAIARLLLGTCVTRRATLAHQFLHRPPVADTLDDLAAGLEVVDNLDEARSLESAAASAWWSG